MVLSTPALLAGGAALAAYLDGKYQLRSDLSAILRLRRSERAANKAAAEGKINAWYLFEDVVRKYPNVTCLWSREGTYTFQQAHDLACKYGNYFLSIGLKSGDLVAFYLQNCIEIPIIWLGLWSIGCAPAFINYNLAGQALIHCLKVSGAEFLLVDTDQGCVERVNGQRSAIEEDLNMKPLFLDQSLKTHVATFPATRPDDRLRRGLDPMFPCCLFYTSGTTGLPKASAFTMHRLYVTSGMRALSSRPGQGGDRWYICMPLYHGTGGIAMQFCLLSGVSVAVGKKFSVTNFWKDVRDSESTHFVYVGETARYLLAAPPSPLDKAHKVRCMYGNGLRPDIWDKFRERFGVEEVAEFFNSTEGVFGLLNYDRGPYQAACVGHHGGLMRFLMRNVYVPVAIDPVTGDILRDPKTGFAKRMSYNEGGEILVAIPNEQAFQGYWRNPESTSKKFVRDVFKKGDLFYRSGDALRRTDDGHWHFLDRLGDTFRWKSENVSTAEVAAALGEFPGVQEANVYGVLVPRHEGRAGCAALLIDPAQRESFNFAAFLHHARQRLPKYAVPVFLRLVEASDHIHNNKQNKVPLREEGVDPAKKGTKSPSGRNDRILWLRPGDDSYSEFMPEDWERLDRGQVKL
ncbi:hypothetical protein VTO42DRAFT_8043 [Malbranchea cinnamomea]